MQHQKSYTKLLSKAGENVTKQDLDLLKEIRLECIACQKFAKKSMRYTATVPEDIMFNHEVVMDIVYVQAKPVLQIVCTLKRFTVAAFVHNKTSETIWNTFSRAWVHPYVGSPHIFRIDQGSGFISQSFYGNCNSHSWHFYKSSSD